MLTMRLGWIALEMIFLVFFLYFGSSGALALTILLILIPLCSFPVHLYVQKFLQAEVQASFSLRKGDQGSFTVQIHNPTLFPVFRVVCSIRVENQLNREHSEIQAMTWFPVGKKQTAQLRVGSKYCGRIRIRILKIRLYDIFGIIGVSKKCNETGYITVQPDLFEMNVNLLAISDGSEESEIYSQEMPGLDLTETFQIREYVPGDSPRQIHWKLSNKFDRLIVRDPSLPITRNVLIFWERTGGSGDPNKIDAQAEVLISLCHSLLDQSVQFVIGWNDQETRRCVFQEIRDLDELIGIIPRLFQAAGTKDGISGAELLVQTAGHALCAHMVYLAEEMQSGVLELQRFGHVSMLLCTDTPMDGAVLFDEKHYAEQLTQIEL